MIREAIKIRIKELKTTQVKVATHVGLNEGNFSGFLSGKRPLPLEDIEKVCEYLKLKLQPID